MRELTPARSIMSVICRRRKRQVRLLGNSRTKPIDLQVVGMLEPMSPSRQSSTGWLCIISS